MSDNISTTPQAQQAPAAAATAAEKPAAEDDLHHAINAIRGLNLEGLTITDGILRSGGASKPSSLTPKDFAAAGASRMVQLLHNQHAHKLEALDRGALVHLAALYSSHPYEMGVQLQANRALRTIVFKNEEARGKIASTNVIASIVSSIRQSLDVIQAHSSGSVRADDASVPSLETLQAVDASAALACLEEALVSLTAIVNRHEANTAATHAAGGLAEVSRAMALLPTAKLPAASSAASTAGSGTAFTKDAQQKAMMLQMILS